MNLGRPFFTVGKVAAIAYGNDFTPSAPGMDFDAAPFFVLFYNPYVSPSIARNDDGANAPRRPLFITIR